MFTFSFGSAFAMTTVVDSKDPDYQVSDFYHGTTLGKHGSGTRGGQGVTAYELDDVAKKLGDVATALTKTGTYTYFTVSGTSYGPGTSKTTDIFHGARLKSVQSLVAATLEAVKTAKTSYAVQNALETLDRKVFDETSQDDLMTAIKATTNLAADFNLTTAKNGTYILPGYGVVANNGTNVAFFENDDVATLTTTTKILPTDLSTATYNAILGWFFDHGFETVAQITDAKKGVMALSDALVQVSNDAAKTIYNTTDPTTDLTSDGLVLYHQAKALKKAIEVADVTNMDATYNVVKAFRDFEAANYPEDNAYTDDNTTLAAAVAYYGAVNFDKKADSIAKMSQTEVLAAKADVVALAESILAFEKKFEKKYDEVDVYGPTAKAAKKYDFATQLGYIEAAGDDTLTDARLALNVALPENLKTADKAAFEAYEAAYTAYKAEFSSDIYEGVAIETSADTEAYLLAGKANFDANVKEDTDAAAKLQNYLNNSTLKVTTSALGNTKIRVNARFDAETYKDIMNLCKSNYTITYKFYHKTAKATAFKGPKEKNRNYITYTKVSLKKGTKYKFQCGVVIKDKDGKVVAEKSYRASTTGSRICR